MARFNWLLGTLFLVSMTSFSGEESVSPALSSGTGIPARQFVRYPTYQTIRLSPDGQHMAVSARVGEQYSLLILRLPDKTLVKALAFRDNRVPGDIRWVSNRRVVMSMAVQDGDAEVPAMIGDLVGIDIDGTYRRKLAGTDSYAIQQGPDLEQPNQLLAMVTNFTEMGRGGRHYSFVKTPLVRINALNGDTHELVPSPVRRPSYYVVNDLATTFLMAGIDDHEYEERLYWRTLEGSWQLVPTGKDRFRPLKISHDGSIVYFARQHPGGEECLVRWTIPLDGDVGQMDDLLCKRGAFLRQVFFTAEGQPYAYSSGAPPGAVIFDDRSDEAQTLSSLQRQFPGQIVYPASASQDHRRVLFRVYSDRNSGEYYLYDADSAEAAYFDADQAWLDPGEMATVLPVTYKARDGLEIEAFLTLPAGLPPSQLPMVVMPHGGPFGIYDVWGWGDDAQFLASRGYAVLQMNFRGSGGHGEDFEKLGYGEWGGKIIDDITDGTRWAVGQGYADPRRLCIFGTSYGGYAALMSAVREPDLYRCAIGYAGVYDLNLLVDTSDASRLEHVRLFWRDSMGASEAERALQSPIQLLDKLNASVLIVHGENDSRAPFSQAKALRKALQKRNKPFQWMTKSDEGHGFFNEDNRTELYEKIEAFLKENIGN